MARGRTVRYAVVAMGHIAQVAVLPAFAHARRNSTLVALVSDDPAQLKTLSKTYGVEDTFSHEEDETCLERVDAVYIALPNSMHAEYTLYQRSSSPAGGAWRRSRGDEPHVT